MCFEPWRSWKSAPMSMKVLHNCFTTGTKFFLNIFLNYCSLPSPSISQTVLPCTCCCCCCCCCIARKACCCCCISVGWGWYTDNCCAPGKSDDRTEKQVVIKAIITITMASCTAPCFSVKSSWRFNEQPQLSPWHKSRVEKH